MSKRMSKDMRLAKRSLRLFFMLGTALVLLIGAIFSVSVIWVLDITGVLTSEMVRQLGLRLATFIYLASITLGSILSFFSMNKIILKPVNQLIDGLGKLSQGDYSVRLKVNDKSEYGKVTNAFNSCAEELEHTEILRSDFINNFSHEIKTPISSINGFAKLLEREDISKEKRKKYLEVIIEETDRLATLTSNILTLTKIEGQSILTEKEEFYLSEQIRYCGLLLERKWKEKELSLVFDFPEYTVVGNQEMLKQVWLNLLDNAIKYANPRTQLKVDIKESQEEFRVEIQNEGIEISEEDKERIFQKFYQVDKTYARSGNGIGLSIVKHVIELHDGQVFVQSGNNRTTFTVIIPKNNAKVVLS